MKTLLVRMAFLGYLLLTTNQLKLLGFPQSQDRSQEKATAEEIAKLIKQLGSPKFTEREAACQRLEKIGLPALANLRQAAESKDLEVRRRARELLRIVSPEVSEPPWEKLLKEGINEERNKKDYKKASEILTKAAKMAEEKFNPNPQVGPPEDIPILTDIYLHLARCHHSLREWKKAGDDYHRAEYHSNFNNEMRKQIEREWSEMTDNLLSDWEKTIKARIAKDPGLTKLADKYSLVLLHSRRFAGGGYLKSAYSFKYETVEVDKHGNDVQMLFDNGADEKNFEVNMLVGQQNLVHDLGDFEFTKDPDPNRLTDKEMKTWQKDSCKAVENHTYLEKVEDNRRNKFFVMFRIVALDKDSNFMAFVWRRLPGGMITKDR